MSSPQLLQFKYGDYQRRTTGGERNQFRRLSPFSHKRAILLYPGVGEEGPHHIWGMDITASSSDVARTSF